MESSNPTMGRGRKAIVWLLLITATLITFGASAEVWVKHQLLDTPSWVKASDKLLADPAVRAALANYIVDEIYSSIDVQSQLADKLPEDWKGLSGPLAAAVRGPVNSTVEKLLASPRVKTVWHEVNATAHRTLVNVLEDKSTVASTANGTVTLDLGAVIRIVATDLGLSQSAVDRIPADIGQITIVKSSQLAAAQTGVKIVRILSWILFVLVVAMYALAVYLARGRRRSTLRNVGWALLLVALGLVVLRTATGNLVLGIVQDSSLHPAVKAVYLIGSELLVGVAMTIATYGAVIVFGTLIVGPSRLAVAARRFIAPVLNADTTTFWIGAAVLFVLVWLWEPTPAFRIWFSVLALAVVGASGLEFLRRRSLVEFPDAHLGADLGGVKHSLSGAWESVSGRVRSIGGGSGGSSDDHVERLQKLEALHSSGALSDDEYAAAKAKVLGSLAD